METEEDRNGTELTEAEDIKKKCKNAQNYTKKNLMTQMTTVVWSLTWSQTSWNAVKWVLRSVTTNKHSGGDGFPVELFSLVQ